MRNLEIFAAVIIGLAVIGFFAGTREAPPPAAPAPAEAAAVDAPNARAYKELRVRAPLSEPSLKLAALPAKAAERTWDEYAIGREEERGRRASRRAYDGAPPVVPHPVDQRDAPACLACHADGVALPDGRVAAPIPHEAYASCVQCHAADAAPSVLPSSPAPWKTNHFEGLASPGPGQRAWQGAPPVIPHDTWLRTNCVACHGNHAQQGLGASHTERGSCVQCHAESRPFP